MPANPAQTVLTNWRWVVSSRRLVCPTRNHPQPTYLNSAALGSTSAGNSLANAALKPAETFLKELLCASMRANVFSLSIQFGLSSTNSSASNSSLAHHDGSDTAMPSNPR